jgi:hypothetical protein
MVSFAPRLPVLLAALCALVQSGCGATSSTEVAPARTRSVSPSSLPTSYRYVLTSSCGERALIGDYRISVRDGTVRSAVAVDPQADPGLPLQAYPTLQALLVMAETAGPQAVVDLQLSPAGIPVSLTIDHLPNAIDDEECYKIGSLELLDG